MMEYEKDTYWWMSWLGMFLLMVAGLAWFIEGYTPPPPPKPWYPAHLGEMLMLTPWQFERAVGDLLVRSGYRAITQVGGAGDLGADLVGFHADGRRVVVQCKRYAPGHRVGTPAIQSFLGMLVVEHQADLGVFVSTSSFTAPAVALADRHGLTLIDGPALTQLIEEARRDEPPQTARQDDPLAQDGARFLSTDEDDPSSCRRCHAPMLPEDRFCARCGTPEALVARRG